MRKFYLLLGFWVALLSANAQNVATFENVNLDPGSWWNGSDQSGGIQSGGFWFPNDYNAEWGNWSGFSVSNMQDSVTPGWSNQYSAIPARGALESENYAVGYAGSPIEMELENPAVVSGFYVTNATYAFLSMKNGDDYSKKFGGEDGSEPDFFKLIVTGTGISGQETSSVEFFLADFTFENDSLDYIVRGWEWMDLSSLGVVNSLKFELESSDVGDWGMNTPAYFCIDNFNGRSPSLSPIVAEAGMEEMDLENNSFYNGADGSGSFTSGGFKFNNNYNASWGSWTGFAASNMTDTATPGYGNQYSAITGNGALGSSAYAVAFPSGGSGIEFEETVVSGFYVTNSTYAYLSMLQGDDYAKQFGGADGTDPDWFKLTVFGISSSGDTTGTVDYYLADFRFEDNSKDYIVNDWQWVDLSSLGQISSLRFHLSSSDVGDWGMNTPGYFCLDQVNHQDLPPEILNPLPAIGENINPQRVFYVPLDSVFTDPDHPDSQIKMAFEGTDNPGLINGSIVVGGKNGTPEITQLSLSVTEGMTGEANVVVSALSNGKTVYHAFRVVVQYPVASPFVEKPELRLYPNPVKNHFRVNVPEETQSIGLFAPTGQRIFQSGGPFGNLLTISVLENYPSGVYILKVKTSRGPLSKKVLKY